MNDKNKSPGLIHACHHGNYHIIEILLKDPRIRSCKLTEAFQICVKTLNSKILYKLFSDKNLSYSPSNNHNESFKFLVAECTPEIAEMIINNPYFSTNGLDQVLVEAIKFNNIDILTYLLSHQIMFNMYDQIKDTIIMALAFIRGDSPLYQRLNPKLTSFGEICKLSKDELLIKLAGFTFKTDITLWTTKKVRGMCCKLCTILIDMNILLIKHLIIVTPEYCHQFRGIIVNNS
jgi:hypothetical protein